MRVGLPVLLCSAALLAATNAAPAQGKPKVVILGFDGADARLVERFMDEGKLPNLSKLREDGAYAPLEPTNPPQTAVSWSSFATGTNPGKTEIFDFLRRDPDDYLPDFAMNTETRRAFLFGARNGIAFGLAAGVIAFALALLVSLVARLSILTRLLVGILAAVAAGLPAGFVASHFLPEELPDAVNHRKGRPMWEILSELGFRVQVIRVPATFPAEELEHGHMVSGLGVPDMRGRIGTPALYTSDVTFRPGDGSREFSLELIPIPERRGTIRTRIIGPYNKAFYDYVVDRRTAGASGASRPEARKRVRQELDDADVPRRFDLPMTLEADDATLKISVSGQSATLRVGEWSDWFVLDFPVNWVVDWASPLKGIARFKLLKLEPEVELYLSPINFHPDCHPIAHSWPPDYGGELARRFGLYKTIGWPEDTWSLPSGVGDEGLFLEDMYFTLDKDQQILEGLLSDKRDDVYIQIFYFTDRIAHLFWRHLDPGHPLHDPARAPAAEAEMLRAYQRMDAIVGRAREIAGPDALFLVLSDHGFASFRRGVNYNTWLVRNGFMTLKGQDDDPATLERLFDTRDLFQNVDWSRTQAYALGLGSLYVNLAGRERDGIVMPGAEYEDVRRRIREGLEALVDPVSGERPVTRVWTREELYTGFDERLLPDLRAGNNLNYRVSWQTMLGGVPKDVIEDNLAPWSGDHCSSEPALVQGVFFSSRPIRKTVVKMVDLAPTVLAAVGAPIPDGLDGEPVQR